MKPQINTDKRRLKKGKAVQVQQEENSSDSRLPTPDYFWLIGCFVVTAIATFFRFWQLELKPLHHDEGVNGFFLTTLFREGIYKYDPTNYHGPTLYYISLAFAKVFGLETFSIRASVAVFGVLIVILTFFLRKYIGTTGSLFAAFALALSPGMVYISRYFIHEILFVFFSLAIVIAVLFFLEGRKPGVFAMVWMTLLLLVCFLPPAINLSSLIGEQNFTLGWVLRIVILVVEAVLVFFVMRLLLNWNDGKPIYLLLASASACLLFATKETAFITIGTMLITCACVWLWQKTYTGIFGEIMENGYEPVELTWQTFRACLGEYSDSLLLLGAAAFVFIFVGVLFFSSFFTYPYGVIGAFETYAFWAKTGTGDHTQNGTWAYAKWLWQIESPILILSAIGTLIAFAKARHRFAMFAGLWAFGLFAAYALIPYKTPWLALSFTLPMCIGAGYGVNELFVSRNVLLKISAGILMLVTIGMLSYQTYQLNFVRYDDEKMPYVYAHTQRGFLKLIKQIEHYAKKSEKGEDAVIEVVSPDFWSIPWYMRNFTNVNYPGEIVDAKDAEMIVAKKDEQEEEIMRKYSAQYKYAGTYPLRPGVELHLLVRRDLADSNAREIYEIRGKNFSGY